MCTSEYADVLTELVLRGLHFVLFTTKPSWQCCRLGLQGYCVELWENQEQAGPCSVYFVAEY
jgi:hypothetical protein